MATVVSSHVPSYTNISDIKSYWMNTIAPNYFKFTDINNYQIGIFGYVNEVMGTTTEDSFNAIAIARREFYPVTAQFTSSLYAMATLQSIDIPLATPAICKAALIIPQDEIINNSTYKDGIYECVIDNCLKIFADDLQFMLDYPIIILSKKTDKWYHTVHYDITVSNSLNTNTAARYISNKVIKDGGVNYVVLFIDCIRQLEMEEVSNVVIKDSIMETITMDIDFDGSLANFEVFYKENANSEEVQLTKVMINAATPNNPYVQYELINTNKIRLTFAYNQIFVPKYNSEIICRIYTTKGKDGNFNLFANDLVATSDSEKYPYNANMTILGKVNGSAVGGTDQLLTEEFRNTVLKAYSTNNTITTSNDLQLYFDDIADDFDNVRILFKKKRDDPLIRLFGAYSVVKDAGENVIPTNTLNIKVNKSDFVHDLSESVTRISIPAGTVFQYENDANYTLVPCRNEDGSLKSLLDIQGEENNGVMYFTNPFLMCVNLDPNNIGYYMNSIDKYMSIEYTYVNDNSVQQFIGGTVSIYRNTSSGSNYYRFRMLVTPATDIDQATLIKVNDPSLEANQIRAKYNGVVIDEKYVFDNVNGYGFVQFTVEYDTEDEAERYFYIQGSNTSPIGGTSVTGYEMQFSVGERFIANDILAVKRVDDLGNLIFCGDLNYMLYSNNYYFPFTIQGYDNDVQAYIMEAYLATADEIDLSEKLIITHGIYNRNGVEDENIAIDMRNIILEMNVLYNNDGNNISNKYTSYAGLNNYTLTNTYISSEDDPFDLIGSLPFIRSTVDFLPGVTGNANDFVITITESPVIGAFWATDTDQFDYFISKCLLINENLTTAYYQLENNFSIDSKFYNTYGKARFFTVGNNRESMVPLDSVKCKFHFGVRLSTISSTEAFITNFRKFIQEYIEADDKITTTGQDLYIMNLISEIKNNFAEITYIEYYGFNSYDYMAQKVIGPDLTDYQDNFIPEFLNLDTLVDVNGLTYPNITVDILD